MAIRFRIRDKSLSGVLSEIADSVPPEGLTVRELVERLGRRGVLLLAMILTLPFLLPISIPGTSLPFGLVIALIGVSITTNRAPWFPNRVMNRRVQSDHLARILEKGAFLCVRVEKLIHPRLLRLTDPPTTGRFNGVMLILAAVMLMLPLPLPFSNALPAYAALFLAAGNMERDGYLIIGGYLMILLSIAYLAVVAVVGTIGVQNLLMPR